MRIQCAPTAWGIYVPLGRTDVAYPEYFRQVTRGRNTRVIHAKYVKPLINNVLLSDRADWRENDVSYHLEVVRSSNETTIYVRSIHEYKRQGIWVSNVTYYRYYYVLGTSWKQRASEGTSWFYYTSNPPVLPWPLASSNGTGPKPSYGVVWRVIDDDGADRFPSPIVGFRFAEPEHAFGRSWRNTEVVVRIQQQLMIDAWSQLARLNESSIQNIIGAVGFLIDVVTGRLANAVSDFAGWIRALRDLAATSWREYFIRLLKLSSQKGPDVWLAYRYAYTTGKLDYEQAADWLDRQMALYSSWLRFDASTVVDSFGVNSTWHLCFYARLREDDIYNMLSSRAWLAGMEINPYVIWDLIPFSFVADWFVDVGDKLELNNDIKHWRRDFHVKDVCWSVKYFSSVNTGTIECYYRFYGPFPALDGYTHYNNVSVSTGLKRAGDTLSLIIGGG